MQELEEGLLEATHAVKREDGAAGEVLVKSVNGSDTEILGFD
jgi:hypothetical protein